MTAPFVDAQHLTQIYGKTSALRDVSITVYPGQITGVLGPDGVGKSTLLDLIAGARVLQDGHLQVLGGDMRKAAHRRSAGPKIAYMPQGLGKNLYHDLSVRENLDFFGKLFDQTREDRATRIDRMTRATGLYPFLDRPASKLSGGMKQKLGLCSALLHDPDLLILDEPTTGVDPLSRKQFWALIDSIRTKRPQMAVLVSTAYMDEAEAFDQLIAMNAGEVLATGTPAALKTQTGADDLEGAFVALLPNADGQQRKLTIPPFQADHTPIAISARHLTRRFGNFTAVNNVSFDIRTGEIFGFLGSNGCGKTTTMKMLTGLLPITEGAADLFGKPVDAHNLAARHRVGFMSQAFSLYGELTVTQNLALHARLFHLDAQAAQARIKNLMARFGLTPHTNSRADTLPLGIRQRLSLAVAILHEPEVLILDEPTSGVDPVARDSFWELLVELSRGEKVTIFISTHFMNEAARCDRISFMHDGQVLVCDTPDGLLKQSGQPTLETAFIHYIAQATDTPKPEGRELIAAPPVAQHPRTFMGFSPSRTLAYSYRETIEVLRDPVRIVFAFFGTLALMIVMGFGISMDVNSISYAVYDLDQTPASRAYISNFQGSEYFKEFPAITQPDDLQRRLQTHEVTLALEIPNGFGRALEKGQTPDVAAWIDGADTSRAGTVEAYVTAAHQTFVSDLIRQAGIPAEAYQHADIEQRYRYNPTFESVLAIGPTIPAILLMMFPAILMAVSVAREKETGTITNFYVTPTRRIEFLLGKQLPYLVISMVNFVALIVLALTVLRVPITGSLATLTAGTFLYALAVTSYGLLISSATRSQVTAVFAAAILSMMPTMQFSGMIQPVSTLSDDAQVIGSFWPASYFMHMSVGTFTKGLGFAELWRDLLALAAFFPGFLMLAALFLRKQAK